jgi:ribosomal protein L37AE/L43A
MAPATPAGDEEMRKFTAAERQAAKADRDRQDCEIVEVMDEAKAVNRAMIAEMEQPTGHPYKASTTSPLCEVCGERKINRYGTHGLPGLEQGDQQAPAEMPIVYLSCQYCHKPAGDRQTKEQGICHDCKQKMVDEGHAWEENNERKRRRVDLLSVNNTTRTGPDGCLPALS